MEAIFFKGETGYICINFNDQEVEIDSSGFSAKGQLSLNKEDITKLKDELNRCVGCSVEEYYKVLYNLSDDTFGIELRCDGENNFIYLLGVYSNNPLKEHRIEFEFRIGKSEIKRAMYNIEQILESIK